jgi:hypothetical protein
MNYFKKSILLLLISIGTMAAEVNAQGGPPPWAPAHGYHAKARYTYFPSLNFYYDTKVGVYFFLDGSSWIKRTTLPSSYKNYNWSKYKNEEFDWSNNQPWEKHYSNGKKKSSSNPGNGNGKVNSQGKGNGKSKG